MIHVLLFYNNKPHEFAEITLPMKFRSIRQVLTVCRHVEAKISAAAHVQHLDMPGPPTIFAPKFNITCGFAFFAVMRYTLPLHQAEQSMPNHTWFHEASGVRA